VLPIKHAGVLFADLSGKLAHGKSGGFAKLTQSTGCFGGAHNGRSIREEWKGGLHLVS